jgi:sorting nexin-9/18/33
MYATEKLTLSLMKDFKKMLPHHLSLPPAGPSFYARVYHPAFNLDSEDAAEAVDRFETHTRALGKGVQGLRSIFTRVREARLGGYLPCHNLAKTGG